MPTKECLTCEDEYSVVSSRADESKFCSRECYHNGQKQGKTEHSDRLVDYVEIECKTCGEKVEKPPSRANRKFCSSDCYNRGQKLGKTSHSGRRVEYVKVECDECGEIMEKTPSSAEHRERDFCDRECYANWSAGYQKKQVGKRQRKRERKEKDCEICGYSRYVEVCHIVPSSRGGTFHESNILFLCPNHHRLLDHGEMNGDEFKKIETKLREAIVKGKGWEEPSLNDE